MKIAVIGCLHGKLDQIYRDVQETEKMNGYLIDLVVVCGDFQAVRGLNDLKCMAVPDKYKELGDFHQYYLGKKHASHLTLVVGGNHEASNYFQQLAYGGWIAPNIYYMGYANVVKVNGVRIGGLSGIFHKKSINKGHFEYLPYNSNTIRSAYHTRYLEVFRMMQLEEQLDVMLTHDWPLRIYKMPGSREYLIGKRPSFKQDIDRDELGSPMHELLLNKLRPKHWFSAHMHLRFETRYVHYRRSNNSHLTNPKSTKSNNQPEATHFLALDKCVVRRPYIEIVNVKSDEFDIRGLEYDLEWLAILRYTDEYVSTQERPSNLPPPPHIKKNYDLNAEKEKIRRALNGRLKIPTNFTISKPYNLEGVDVDPERKNNYVNEQTTRLCKLLEITDPMQRFVDRIEGKITNPDKISISDDEEPDWIDENNKNNENSVNNVIPEAEFNEDINYENNEMFAIESNTQMLAIEGNVGNAGYMWAVEQASSINHYREQDIEDIEGNRELLMIKYERQDGALTNEEDAIMSSQKSVKSERQDAGLNNEEDATMYSQNANRDTEMSGDDLNNDEDATMNSQNTVKHERPDADLNNEEDAVMNSQNSFANRDTEMGGDGLNFEQDYLKMSEAFQPAKRSDSESDDEAPNPKRIKEERNDFFFFDKKGDQAPNVFFETKGSN